MRQPQVVCIFAEVLFTFQVKYTLLVLRVCLLENVVYTFVHFLK